MAEIDLMEELEELNPSGLVLFTTYSLAPPFFEKNVLSNFQDKTFPLIVTDYAEYQAKTFALGASRYAERKYFVTYAKSAGTFHPKLLLSVEDKGIKLFVGSNNLTKEGFTSSAELVVPIAIDAGAKEGGELLGEVKDFLDCLQGRVVSDRHRAEVERLIGELPAVCSSGDRDAWIIHSMRRPILDSALEIIGEPVEELEVLSPFFSQDAEFYRRLTEVAVSVHIVVQEGQSDLPVNTLRRFANIRFSTISSKRYIHAKMYSFRTKGARYLMVGSANCTRAALMGTDNVELVVLFRTGQQLEAVLSRLGEVKPAEINSIKTVSRKEDDEYAAPDIKIIGAVKTGETLRITLDRSLEAGEVQLLVGGASKAWKLVRTGNTFEFQIPDEEQATFTRSVVVSLEATVGGKRVLSDKLLVHNRSIFADAFDLLNTVDTSDASWLFRVLKKLSKMDDFGYYARLLLEIDDKMANRERLEDAVKSMNTKTLLKKEPDPTDPKSRLGNVIGEFIDRHKGKINRALDNQEVESYRKLLSSFLLVNKLILFSASRKYLPSGRSDVELLPYIRANMERFILGKDSYIDMLCQNDLCSVVEDSDLKYHVAILSLAVDLYQGSSTDYAPDPRHGFSHLRRVFQKTNFSSLRKVMELTGSDLAKDKLDRYLKEYGEAWEPLSPMSGTQFVELLNARLKEVNTFMRPMCPMVELLGVERPVP